MKKLDYRQKLANELKKFGLKDSSVNVYLAGSSDKKPARYIQLLLAQNRAVKHPIDKWGLEIKPYLQEKAQKCNS
ncbi:hypothetical protein [Campylobacter suis]|uniref:Uncharacterized protein n=1 Tax=Campylobacter suis TaxID=2790657 RepID=A0ABM8Q5T9_9BACT|nr:hypothetical protein [Campylobacter suis]CAD7288252.1 hypothetical protein LMG8286_01220 [Campylobacter suis]